jgi:hypothetical protein
MVFRYVCMHISAVHACMMHVFMHHMPHASRAPWHCFRASCQRKHHYSAHTYMHAYIHTYMNTYIQVALRLAERYITAFEHLAKENNTILLPSNPGDPAAMVTTALGIFNQIKGKGATHVSYIYMPINMYGFMYVYIHTYILWYPPTVLAVQPWGHYAAGNVSSLKAKGVCVYIYIY